MTKYVFFYIEKEIANKKYCDIIQHLNFDFVRNDLEPVWKHGVKSRSKKF